MLTMSRRHLMRTATALSILAALPLAAAPAHAEDSVHTVLNNLIKKYSDEAKAGMSNTEVSALFEKDGFRDYLDVYPVGDLAGGFVWKPGMGATFTGPFSKLEI